MAQAIAPSSSDRPDAARTGDVPAVVKADPLEALGGFLRVLLPGESRCASLSHAVWDRVGGVRPGSADPPCHLSRRCADRSGSRHHRHRRPAETEKALSLPSAMGLPATGVGSPRPRGRKPKRARGSPG